MVSNPAITRLNRRARVERGEYVVKSSVSGIGFSVGFGQLCPRPNLYSAAIPSGIIRELAMGF